MRFTNIWKLSEIKQDKDVNVFTIFSCGGGSSMGYKRAGFNVIGNCEIDPKMNEIYLKNNHPKYNYNMDIRDFLQKEDLPEELYNLDILDGSPPCSLFSMAGMREKGWGKEKAFREGQKKQTLDDLFFVFLNVVEKLRPKVVVTENVKGLILGNARKYVNEVIKRLKELGYDVQIFLLNAAYMNVPQRRERVFFVANRMGYKKLKLDFKEPLLTFGEIKEGVGGPITAGTLTKKWADMAKQGDVTMEDTKQRMGYKGGSFNQTYVWENEVPMTVTAGSTPIRGSDKTWCSVQDVRRMQTFPEDYDFVNNNVTNATYVCGMSVPPNMMANIATEIWKQWLSKEKKGK